MPVPIIAAGIGAVATMSAAKSQASAQKSAANSQAQAAQAQAQASVQAAQTSANASIQSAQIQSQAAIESQRIQAEALRQQAQASLEAARVTSAAQIEVANKQMEASIKASRDAMKAAIHAAALSQEQRIEQVVRRLPHESGAATLASFDQAQQWETYRNMMMYQDVAKEYFAGGKDGKILHRDPTWNVLNMTKQLRDTTQSAINMAGIRSSSNPAGIPLSWEDYKELYTLKDPDELLKVDPRVQQMYEANYAKWRNDMSRTPEGALIVKLYENPQLAGQGIEGLLGEKTPISVDDDGNVTGGKYNSPHVETIKKLKQMGVIDANNMINGGEVLNMIPKDLRQPPQFDPRKELSPEEEKRLRDKYNALSQGAKWDPKNVKEEYLGYGVTRHTYYNQDGSVAHQFMSGEMTMADGSISGQVMIQGSTLAEWDKFQGLSDGMGASFPGMFRLGANDYNATEAARGSERPGTTRGQAPPPMEGMASLDKPSGARSRSAQESVPAVTNPYSGGSSSGSGGKAPSNTGSSLKGLQSKVASSVPAGYQGAPLAAGE